MQIQPVDKNIHPIALTDLQMADFYHGMVSDQNVTLDERYLEGIKWWMEGEQMEKAG